jgi:hypothetical protein
MWSRFVLTALALVVAGCGSEPGAPPDPPESALPQASRGAVTIEKDAVIGVRLDHAIDSASARENDAVSALVSRDCVAGGRTAIPAGARLEGSIVLIDRTPDNGARARIGVRFHTLVAEGTERLAIQTDPIVRLAGAPKDLPAGSFLTVRLTAPLTIDR